VPEGLLRAAAAVGLAAIIVASLLLAGGAAGAPTQYVPARTGGWPGWLAGPLSGLHVGLPGDRFQTLMLVMCGGYALALVGARSLAPAVLAGAIVLAHVIYALGPPLISQDVFGYIAFGRLGALHGLDPYTHFPSQAPTDPTFHFIGWPFQHSPYGPLFTLTSYAIAPLGVAADVWIFKALAAISSLGATLLVARAAGAAGHSRRWAAAFVGLNPVVLALAVGGAHNDTLLLLAFAAALALAGPPGAARTAQHPSHPRAAMAALVAGVGVKITAGLAVPFLALSPRRWRERWTLAATAAVGLIGLAAIALLAFGTHAFGFLDAIGEQQQLVATHSIPAETARLLGLGSTPPAWWRHLFLGAFAVVVLVALRHTARGGDWRAGVGWTAIALLVCTAWLLPWYAIWPLPLAAVCGDRRLRAAALVVCAYAVLIHLSLANGLLGPRPHHVHHRLPFRVPGVVHRVELTGFEVLRDIHRDFRW
jgi:hypothetical protein